MFTRTEILLLAAIVVACKGDDGDGRPPVPAPEILDVQAAVAAPMGTVVEVTWQTDIATASFVEFGVGGAFDRSTAAGEASTAHQASLVALPPGEAISYRVVAGDTVGEVGTVTTGSLPIPAPELVVEGGAHDRFLTLARIGQDTAHALVIDPAGRVVWAHEDTRGLSVFRIRVAADGTGIVYTSSLDRGQPTEGSAVVRVPWDGSAEQVVEVPWLAHDFVELPDGTVVSLAYEFRDDVEGNKLVALSPDGQITDLWSTWDCFDPVANPSIDPGHGWTHANALDYDPDSDAFLVGLRNLGTIVLVDRATGACGWAFGGDAGSVDIDGQGFLHQHQFSWIDGGFLVFDNDGAPGNESRVLEYSFDDGAGEARQVRAIHADPPLYSFILGDAHRLDDGDTVIVWSAEGVVDRVDEDDASVWRLSTADGGILGFAEVLLDPGRPELGGTL